METLNHCPNCECYECDTARQRIADEETLRLMCERWNWNAHPIEVARDIRDAVDSGWLASEEQALRAIEEFFNSDVRATVEEALNYL